MNYKFTKKPTYTELYNLNHKGVIETLEELKDTKAFYMVKPLAATKYGTLFCVKVYGHLPIDWGFDEEDNYDYCKGNVDFDYLKELYNLSMEAE